MTSRLRLVCGVIGSGKDHAVGRFFKQKNIAMSDTILPYHIKFAAPMVKLAAKLYNVDFSTEEKYTSWKSIPENREKLVNLAEGMKELYGEQFWISQTIKELQDLLQQSFENLTYPIFAISDFRFPFEYFLIKEFCEKNSLLLDVEFVNYESDRYSIRKDHPGEQLAIYLIEQGYKPQVWSSSEFEKILNLYISHT